MAKELTNFRQGDTKKIEVNYGTGVDISGYKFWFTLRSKFEGPIVAQTITTAGANAAGPDLMDDILNGLVYLQMNSDITSLIPVGKYFWDIQRVRPNTNPPDVLTLRPTIKLSKDKIEILPQVTLVSV